MNKARAQKSATMAAAVPTPAIGNAPPAVGKYAPSAAFFVAVSLLAYLGQTEGCYNHGLFSATVYEPYADFRSIPKVGGEVNRVEAGRDLYSSVGCVSCHQPNGSGNPANGCPPLAKSDWVLAEAPGRMIRIVLHGALGPIKVNGQNYGGNMTPFGPSGGVNLSDDQIANILTFVRQAPEWGNKAAEVTPEMVKGVRDKTASRTTQWTADELLKIPVTE